MAPHRLRRAAVLPCAVLPVSDVAGAVTVSANPTVIGPLHVQAERDLEELRTLSGANPNAATDNWDINCSVDHHFTPRDGVLTVYPNFASGAVLHVSGFDAGRVLDADASITGVELVAVYSVEDQGLEPYAGTRPLRFDDGSGLVDTTILPQAGDIGVTRTFDLFAAGVDTIAEIGALEVEFTNDSDNIFLRVMGES